MRRAALALLLVVPLLGAPAGAQVRETMTVEVIEVPLHETFQLPAGTYATKALTRIAGTNVLGFARNDFTLGE